VTDELALRGAVLTLYSSVDRRDTCSGSMIMAVLRFIDTAASDCLILCCTFSVSSGAVHSCINVTANGFSTSLQGVSMEEC
jgi:hypothetical protein